MQFINTAAIKVARIQAGLSVNQLARKLGWDPRTVTKLEETGVVYESKMVEICRELGLNIMAFLPADLQNVNNGESENERIQKD